MGRGLLALGVVGVIVAVIIMTSGKPAANPGTGAGRDNPAADPKGSPAVAAPVKITLECESPTTIFDKFEDTVILKVKTQSEGKTISFLEIPNDWMKSCGVDTEDKGTDGPKFKDKAGQATYDFETPRDDTFYLNLRARWSDECGDSVFVKLDDSPWFTLEDSNGKQGDKNYRWAWHQLMLGGKAKGFELKKGKHTLYFGTREDGPCLDNWLVTTEASQPVEKPVTGAP